MSLQVPFMTWILLSHQSDITHYYLSAKDVTNTVSILDVVIVSVTILKSNNHSLLF